MYWLIGRKSKLSTSNEPLLYNAILKPIWTYGIQLWGTASASNIETLERFHSKTLRMSGRVLVRAEHGSPNTNSYRRNPTQQLSIQLPPQCTPRRRNSEPRGAARQQACSNPDEVITFYLPTGLTLPAALWSWVLLGL
jgi:hypothetical protein